MRKEKVGGFTLELYESIDELPVRRFHKFNKLMLLESNIGSDLSSITQHISKVEAFISKGDNEKAVKQLRNLRQNMFQTVEELNIGHMAYVPFIYSINGKLFTDLSDENIKATSQKLSHASKGFIERLVDLLKKKVEAELTTYFPEYGVDPVASEFTGRLRSRALLQLNAILQKQDNEDKIRQLDEGLLTMFKPKTFHGKSNAEVQHSKNFYEMCVMLQEGLNFEVSDKTTVLEFYTAAERLKKKYKQKTKSHGRREPA